VVTYRRETDDRAVRVLANLSAAPVCWALPPDESVGGVLLSTGHVEVGGEGLRLGAHSGGVVSLQPAG
jgi:hypothetical protein